MTEQLTFRAILTNIRRARKMGNGLQARAWQLVLEREGFAQWYPSAHPIKDDLEAALLRAHRAGAFDDVGLRAQLAYGVPWCPVHEARELLIGQCVACFMEARHGERA